MRHQGTRLLLGFWHILEARIGAGSDESYIFHDRAPRIDPAASLAFLDLHPTSIDDSYTTRAVTPLLTCFSPTVWREILHGCALSRG